MKTLEGIPSDYDNVYGLQYETYDPVYDSGPGLADYGRSISDLQPDDVFGAMGLADMAGAGDVSAQVALAGGGLSDLLSTIQGSPRFMIFSEPIELILFKILKVILEKLLANESSEIVLCMIKSMH